MNNETVRYLLLLVLIAAAAFAGLTGWYGVIIHERRINNIEVRLNDLERTSRESETDEKDSPRR